MSLTAFLYVRRGFVGFSAGLAAIALTGCIVHPVEYERMARADAAQRANAGSISASAAVAPMAAPVAQIGTRLYPDNPAATKYGMTSGTIITHNDGRGVFSFAMNGETFNGEATRNPGSASGTANAAGNRGNFMKCVYTMTSNVQGKGMCDLSDGARFAMHIGN